MSTEMPTEPVDCNELKKLIREVPDFPKKGILFYDITTLLKDKLGFARLIDALSANYIEMCIRDSPVPVGFAKIGRASCRERV